MGQCHSCEKREKKPPPQPAVNSEPEGRFIDQQTEAPNAIQVLAEDFDNSALGTLQKKLQKRIGQKAIKEFSRKSLKSKHGQQWFELEELFYNPVNERDHVTTVTLQNACRELLAQNKELSQKLKNRKSQARTVWALIGVLATVFIYAIVLSGVVYSNALCHWCAKQ